ncbi:MAG TPA: hypothetical protein VKN64_04465 [Halanaerobiales bacterium]|nr:hypothetical protein [Halanaerobiales bacterium]
MIEQKLRLEADYLARAILKNKGSFNSNNIKRASEELLLSKAWLGKMLSELNYVSPYKNDGKRKDVGDIEKADSLYEGDFSEFNSLSQIEKVDIIREKIKGMINDIKDIGIVKNREYNIARTNVYNHLCLTCFFLGYELERIKLKNDNK